MHRSQPKSYEPQRQDNVKNKSNQVNLHYNPQNRINSYESTVIQMFE
jgi:hypothetical protein